MSKIRVKSIVLAGMIGALYAVLSYFGSIFGLTFWAVQFRFAEALTVLPFLFPETAPGLFIGCLITNLLSPYGLVDIVCGSLATALAAFLTAKMPNRWLAPLPAVLCNGIIVGGMIAWYEVGFGAGFWPVFTVNGAWVALGEIGPCYVLGMLLLTVIPKIPYIKSMISPARLAH
jgi:uncharacterized membrane protein